MVLRLCPTGIRLRRSGYRLTPIRLRKPAISLVEALCTTPQQGNTRAFLSFPFEPFYHTIMRFAFVIIDPNQHDLAIKIF